MTKYTLIIGLSALFLANAVALYAGDIKGKVKAKGWKHSGDAVIYIDKIPGKQFDPPKEPATMDQKILSSFRIFSRFSPERPLIT